MSSTSPRPLTARVSRALAPLFATSDRTRIVERPKVIFTASTQTYVMYLHIDNMSYSEMKVGVATSPTPCGPYTYRGSSQPPSTGISAPCT